MFSGHALRRSQLVSSRLVGWVAASLAAASTLSCSSDTIVPGSVRIAMSTDMVVPADLAKVGLYIQRLEGTRVTGSWNEEQAPLCETDANGAIVRCEVRFPATYVVQAAPGTSPRVRIRLVGFDGAGKASIMREVRTSVVEAREQLLRMPLLWVNSGGVQDLAPTPADTGAQQGGVGVLAEGNPAGFDPFTRFVDRCNAPGTADDDLRTHADDGRCVSIDEVPLSATPLPSGEERARCIDAAACFREGERRFRVLGLRDEAGGCSLEVPTRLDPSKVNIALVVPAGQGHRVDDGLSIRPLALGTSFQACAADPSPCAGDATAGAENLFLPQAVCEKIRATAGDTDPELVVSSRCPSFTVDSLLCTSWNETGEAEAEEAARVIPADTPASWFEVAATGELRSFSTQGHDLLLGMADASGRVDAHRFAAPPFANDRSQQAVAARADDVTDVATRTVQEVIRVSSDRRNLRPRGGDWQPFSEAYVSDGKNGIHYLQPGGQAPRPVRFSLDCSRDDTSWAPHHNDGRIEAIALARIDATATDVAEMFNAVARNHQVDGLIDANALGGIGLALVSISQRGETADGPRRWMSAVALTGSALLSGRPVMGLETGIHYSSANPECMQILSTNERYGDPGVPLPAGVTQRDYCAQQPCGLLFDAPGPLGRGTEITPNELGLFIPYTRRFEAGDTKEFRWCGMTDPDFMMSTIGRAIVAGQAPNLPDTPVGCYPEFLDVAGPLQLGALAIGGGFRDAEASQRRQLFSLVDPAGTPAIKLFETEQSLFETDADGNEIRVDADGNPVAPGELGSRVHRERRLWSETAERVYARPTTDTRLVSYSTDGGAQNVACYVAETPTVACYDDGGTPISLPLETGFISRMFVDDTNLNADESHLYIALQCSTAAGATQPGRVFVYRFPWNRITGATPMETLPNPCEDPNPR